MSRYDDNAIQAEINAFIEKLPDHRKNEARVKITVGAAQRELMAPQFRSDEELDDLDKTINIEWAVRIVAGQDLVNAQAQNQQNQASFWQNQPATGTPPSQEKPPSPRQPK